MPSPVEGLGLAPRKKNQFCAKHYAILNKFWYFFPILQHKNFQHVTSASEKVGRLSPVLKVGDLSPCPPAPTPMAVLPLKVSMRIRSIVRLGDGFNFYSFKKKIR